MTREPDITARLRDIYATHPMVMEAADEIERKERMIAACRSINNKLVSEIAWLTECLERLRVLLRRHQVAVWCEEDSDLAAETRAALGPNASDVAPDVAPAPDAKSKT